MRIKIIVFAILSLFYIKTGFSQSIVINELSNGPSGGSKEYVEFVVTGNVSCDTPPDTIDLRHWIFDDNNGYFASGSGTGIAQGVCRFSNNNLWAKIPVGTIILIYNDADRNADIPADDLSMSDGNCRLVIPISSSLFERNENTPNSSNSNYPASGWVSGGNWTVVSMSNSNDSYQIRDINNISTPVHSVSYGNNSNNTIIYFAGSGGDISYYFDNTNNDDPFQQNNWKAGSASNNNNNNGAYENGNNDQTPGYPNSVNNENWIISLNHGCSLPPIVDAGPDQTICGGSTTITATGGSPSAVYTWNNGLGNGASHTVSPSSNTEYIVTMTDNGWCVSDTVEIFVSNNINFTLSSSNPTACGESNGSITISGLDANTNYQISYNGGASTQMTSDANGEIIITNLGAGDYTDFIVELNGCQATDNTTISLTEPNAPSVDAGANQTICEGQSVTLTASNPDNANISWDNNISDGVAFTPNVGTTTYTVTASLNGCTSTDNVIVTVNQNPTPVIVGNLSFCSGSSTSLSTSTTYVTYSWLPNNETSQSINVNTAGNYSVTVTDANACSGSAQVNVVENPNPIPTITGNLNVCYGETSVLDAGSGYTSYLWSPNNETSQSINVNTSGTYSVTVFDNNDCSGTAQATVNVSADLTPTITGVLSICSGTPTTLDAGAGYSSYHWSNSETTQTINVTTGGTYSVTVSDGNCTGVNQVTVTENENPTPTITGDSIICEGNSTNLSVGSYASYSWNTSQNSQSINVSQAGTYEVTVTTNAGCTGTDEFTVNVVPGVSVSISGNLNICKGEHTTLDAGSGYSHYNWSTGSNTQTTNISQSGLYSVTVSDNNGCQASDAVNVNVSNINLISNGDKTICAGTSTTISVAVTGSGIPPFNYIWNTGETSSSINISPAKDTMYSVFVSDAIGCISDTKYINVHIIPGVSLSLFINKDTICPGDAIMVTSLIQNGMPPYSIYDENNNVVNLNSVIYPTSSSDIIYTVTDACNSTDKDTINIGFYPIPSLNPVSDISQGCLPLTVNFTDGNNNSNLSYVWTFAGTSENNLSLDKAPAHTFTESDTYDVTLQATTKDGCKVEQTIDNMITVYPKPKARFEALPDVKTIINPVFNFSNYTENATNYLWSFGDGDSSDIFEPSHIYNSIGEYLVELTAVSSYGCKDTVRHLLKVKDIFTLFVPTAFSPDNDGINDFFFVQGNGIDTDNFNLRIYDRWGELIWQTDNLFEKWDGTVKNGSYIVSPDTYIWLVTCKDFDGNEHQKTGQVTIVR